MREVQHKDEFLLIILSKLPGMDSEKFQQQYLPWFRTVADKFEIYVLGRLHQDSIYYFSPGAMQASNGKVELPGETARFLRKDLPEGVVRVTSKLLTPV